MIRHTKIGQAILFVVLLFSGGVYAEDLGEIPHDSCWLFDGVYSNIGNKLWSSKGYGNFKNPTLTRTGFDKYLPSYQEDNIDAVRIKNDIENRSLNVEARLKVFEGDKPPYEPISFSYEYDDCIDGKVAFTRYEEVYADGTTTRSTKTITLWLDKDKPLRVDYVLDTKYTHFFIIRTKERVERYYEFRQFIDKSAVQ